MKKQRTKTAHGRWWIFLMGGIAILNAGSIRSTYFHTAHYCYAEEKIPGQSTQEKKKYLLEKTNEERVKKGLSQLVEDEKLSSAATVRAKEQYNLFSHTRPDGSPFHTVFSQFCIGGNMRGENLARGLPEEHERIFQAWLDSKSHHKVMLYDQFTKIGIGYAENEGVAYWCLLFAG